MANNSENSNPTSQLNELRASKDIFLRTERYPRPPYSEATYYIYEKSGVVICTKMEVCNKYGDCESQYKQGVYKDPEDAQAGAPYGATSPVLIPKEKLMKHTCLNKFSLVSSP
ncbi:hypothetical protein DWU99_18445 [Dyella psychrodurans]|uniref:Uncharacterized protein n=1 Tax=Dyella psychrodurans TaxID=1927960 RepID=A0A370WY36_9GAMM|nr:hypothetical protein DWU99_18445 [Dyella psychrodurans]